MMEYKEKSFIQPTVFLYCFIHRDHTLYHRNIPYTSDSWLDVRTRGGGGGVIQMPTVCNKGRTCSCVCV